ncbi:Tip41 protein [Martiniozyma asiatica (nom. inval.)]|nr:Tip41 protein [Martiniozyma asiatica]
MSNPYAFNIDSARQMHALSTSGRFPKKEIKSMKPQVIENEPIADNISIPAKTETDKPTNNPPCDCCGTVIIPPPASQFPIESKPSISIDEWSIYTKRSPILNSNEIDQFESMLQIPVPEMIFGNNKVEIKHSKFHIHFNALDALRKVELNPSNLIKVAYANEWFKPRQNKHAGSEVKMEVYKPFDWTYSNEYKGTTLIGNWIETDNDIPMDKLLQNNPILFYDDMILYEDELADNGCSLLNVKIRVMNNCLLLLQRLFVRVDDVLVRIYDTRLYVDFETDQVVREWKFMEDTYANVLAKAVGNDKKRCLRDPQWCSTVLPVKKIIRDELYVEKNT